MRYIPAGQLRPGMVLGQDLFDAAGRRMLATNTKLTEENIDYIEFIGTAGVYIDDEVSKNIQIQETVSPQVKTEAVSLIQQVFSKAPEEEDNLQPEERLIRLVVENVVSDVMSNKDVMYNMIDIRNYNDYTYFHSMNVGVMAGILGAKMELPEEELSDLVTAAFLHDIGKTKVLPDLVNATRKLTPEEQEEMKTHAQVGYDYLTRKFSFPETVTQVVLQHHEWFNGQGYPNHLKGKDLSLNARILRVVDTYDSMTSKRPYCKPYQPADVMEYIMARTGLEFDPRVVSVMSSQFCIYPIGSEVILSDGRHAIVTENHPGFIGRPTVKFIEDGQEINLRSERGAYNITIVQLLV